jgi:hypothetical protein
VGLLDNYISHNDDDDGDDDFFPLIGTIRDVERICFFTLLLLFFGSGWIFFGVLTGRPDGASGNEDDRCG